MTQTGGLTVLLAWAIFGAILAVLAYLLLRHEKTPCKTSLPPPPTSPNPRLAAHSHPTARQAAPPRRQPASQRLTGQLHCRQPARKLSYQVIAYGH